MYENEDIQYTSKIHSLFVLNIFRMLKEYYYIDRTSISVLSIASIYSNTINDA